MTTEDFLSRFAELLGATPDAVRPSTALRDLEGWDSMGQLSAVALLDELGVKIPSGALQKAERVEDILSLLRGKIEG